MTRRRLAQFLDAGRAPSGADLALAREVLSGALLDLFLAQHPRDIVHSTGTARWLLERGHADHALLVAALLHDVGKGHQRRTDRAAWVVANWAGVGKFAAAEGSRFELRRALARTASHSETSAHALAAAGAPSLAVGLTRRHHLRQPGDAMLTLLQAADAAN
jgi:hypothetical protein